MTSENLILGGGRTLQTQGSVRNAAGYKAGGSGPDLASIREAAQAAADTQKVWEEVYEAFQIGALVCVSTARVYN